MPNRSFQTSTFASYSASIITIFMTSPPSFDRVYDDMDDDFRPDSDVLNQPEANRCDESWLRLRLGCSDDQSSSSTLDTRRGGLVEFDLLTATNNSSHHQQQKQLISRSNTSPPGFFHQPEFRAPWRPSARIGSPGIKWASVRPSNIMMEEQQFGSNYYMKNPASMSLKPMGPDFFARPDFGATQMGINGREASSSSFGMRIIKPPRRPRVGVWFMLLAWQNQVREPFLPQIPKRYLRIKNGRMDIRLLMKYLAQKLGLESESDVEIRCRGQELQPILTVQHVRDNIWCKRDMPIVTLLTDSLSPSTSADAAYSRHIMILHYARPLLILSATAAVETTATTSSTNLNF